MKILNLHAKDGAGFYLHRGQKNAATALGFEWVDWDGDRQTYEQVDPDLVIVDINKPDIYLPNHSSRKAKVAMIVCQWSDEPVWPEVYNRGYRTKGDDLAYVDRVNPDSLYHHCTQAGIYQGFKFWFERAQRPVHSVPLLADFHYFYRPWQEVREHEYDVAYVGGRWPYKSHTLDSYLLPILQDSHVRSIVYGGGSWADCAGINYSGRLPDTEEANLYSQSRIVPAIHEPHSSIGYDIVLRVFTPFLSGALVVSDKNPSILDEHFFALDEICVAENPDEYKGYIKMALFDDRFRRDRAYKGHKRVIKDHTMEMNIANMLEINGFIKEAEYAREYAHQRYLTIFGPNA
jgi:hypothetical protein